MKKRKYKKKYGKTNWKLDPSQKVLGDDEEEEGDGGVFAIFLFEYLWILKLLFFLFCFLAATVVAAAIIVVVVVVVAAHFGLTFKV